jgi:hypothetical protein
MIRTIVIAAAFACAALPAIAATPDCLRGNQIRGFQALSDRELIVTDNFRHKFKVTVLGTCNDLTFKNVVGFKSFSGFGMACVQSGDTLVVGSDPGEPRLGGRCPVTKVVAYTPEMERADVAAKAAAKAKARR